MKDTRDIDEFCDWLDVNFSNMGLKPLSLATGSCGVNINGELVLGQTLIVTKIATFLHDQKRKQILAVWNDKNFKYIWINWPLDFQEREYRKAAIKVFQQAIKAHDEIH